MDLQKVRQYFNVRRKIYGFWAVILLVGFIATQFHQTEQINALWIFLALLGLGYMYEEMPLKSKVMQKILLLWILVISLGILISFLCFSVPSLYFLINYLGIFWLFHLSVGHILNGIVERKQIYFWTGALQLIAGFLVLLFQMFLLPFQYLLVGIFSSLAMILLIFLF